MAQNYNISFVSHISALFGATEEFAETLMGSKAVQNLLKSNDTFDLIIHQVILCDVLLGLSHHFKAPVVAFSTIGPNEITSMIFGHPLPHAYVSSLFLSYPSEMTFFQRVINTIVSESFQFLFRAMVWRAHDKVLHKHLPDSPPLSELHLNISLVLMNTHYSLESPKPYMPNMIQVGGIQIVDEELPEDLKLFLDEAEEGAVLFSLGSNLKSSELPPETLDAILKVFAKFKNKFLWKFENESLVVPENLKILKWLPQRAILGKKYPFQK